MLYSRHRFVFAASRGTIRNRRCPNTISDPARQVYPLEPEKPFATTASSIHSQLLDRLDGQKFVRAQAIEPKSNDLKSILETALAEPLFYPPLAQSVFPGDTVAIAIQNDLPNPRLVIEALLSQLNELAIEPSDIVIVVTPRTAESLGLPPTHSGKETDQRPPHAIVEFGFHSINIEVHEPDNATGLSYIVANEAGDPMYVNRTLVDADVVIPIGFPVAGAADRQTDCIYPDFSNESVQARFSDGKGSFLSRWNEIELANDTLGSFFSIQIVCGPGDVIEEVICGARNDAVARARAATNQRWSIEWAGDSDMTVATIESSATQQDWEDFSIALTTASHFGEGPIVLWSEISATPDRKIRKALLSQFEEGISAKLTKLQRHVAAIVGERPVYVRSQLSRGQIEELGLGFVESAEEVLKIAADKAQIAVVRDAHRCQLNTEPNAY